MEPTTPPDQNSFVLNTPSSISHTAPLSKSKSRIIVYRWPLLILFFGIIIAAFYYINFRSAYEIPSVQVPDSKEAAKNLGGSLVKRDSQAQLEGISFDFDEFMESVELKTNFVFPDILNEETALSGEILPLPLPLVYDGPPDHLSRIDYVDDWKGFRATYDFDINVSETFNQYFSETSPILNSPGISIREFILYKNAIFIAIADKDYIYKVFVYPKNSSSTEMMIVSVLRKKS